MIGAVQQGNVKTGLDVLREGNFASLRSRKLGLLVNQASIASDLSHVVALVLDSGLDVRVLFGPEHGLDGVVQDMELVGHGSSSVGGIPIVSLYGQGPESLRPPRDLLDDIDVLVVDLQDIGSRYYTYAVSMRYCMEACAETGVSFLVLDRPNPINGVFLEGPLLQDAYRSFVGGYPVPVRHGLTMGELARLVVQEGLEVQLEVVAMQGWRRDMWYDQTGLIWIGPSPNMPTLDTATVYPGSCLVEATNLSEGRGTTRPFELLGAPWLNAKELATELNALALPGVCFRPASFCPGFQKHAGRVCHGVQLHVVDRRVFRPFLSGLLLLQKTRQHSLERFGWREEPYEFVSNLPAIDLLAGGAELRESLENQADPLDLYSQWERELQEFRSLRRDVLLYPEEEP